MKHAANCLIFIALFGFSSAKTYAQGTPPPSPSPSPAPSSDTSKPVAITMNAGFDVIIKKNGDLLYGLVKEVGPVLIRYRRTDIPDGPIYTVLREEVYAISYRNQIKDIINPRIDPPVVHDTVVLHDALPVAPPAAQSGTSNTAGSGMPKTKGLSRNLFFRDGKIRIGLGVLRSYTRVSQVSQYSSAVAFPIISLGYDVHYNQQLRLGAQVAFGPHHFSQQQYDAYDGTQNNIKLDESIFMIDLYGKYSFSYHTDKLQPYILAGIGIHSSHVNSNYNVNFINNQNNPLLIKSGSNSVGLGIIARVGTEYTLNRTTRLFGDVGIGASVLNFGVSLNVN